MAHKYTKTRRCEVCEKPLYPVQLPSGKMYLGSPRWCEVCCPPEVKKKREYNREYRKL